MVRVGSRSQSEELKSMNLFELKKQFEDDYKGYEKCTKEQRKNDIKTKKKKQKETERSMNDKFKPI